jgi:hypothetical protein
MSTVLQAIAKLMIYYCSNFTQLPGVPGSPVYRFEVDGTIAILSCTDREGLAEDVAKGIL